uniref:Uncharacterized protein n=1 Tax=Hucho hucho TaxID=62062 RepID=A0A4W5LK11_9TELE
MSLCVCLSHGTEIFQCFLSAREAARSRERERASSSAGGGLTSGGTRGGGVGGGEDEATASQEEQHRRDSCTGLPEGQDLYTAACNSVVHRCALLVLGVSPVLGELGKQHQDEGHGTFQSASQGQQDGTAFMTRSEPHNFYDCMVCSV